jgi:hypothetical protein
MSLTFWQESPSIFSWSRIRRILVLVAAYSLWHTRWHKAGVDILLAYLIFSLYWESRSMKTARIAVRAEDEGLTEAKLGS